MRTYIENKFGIYYSFLIKEYRYFGFKIEPSWDGTRFLLFGFWWFHILYDTGDHY